ncbi:MAG TPA: hypothetical protein VN643_27750 [Pyrinomonadaceae bacterium]|nr:hypothetical protein [Pyrinomonadaceae bacterium]
MTKNTVSIAWDGDSMARFARLLGTRPSAIGVHCGDEDGDADGVFGTVASGVHCGDDDGADG